MSDSQPFGPGFVLGGVLCEADLNFRFEVWSRSSPLSNQKVDQMFALWKRQGNEEGRNQTVRLQYLGDS